MSFIQRVLAHNRYCVRTTSWCYASYSTTAAPDHENDGEREGEPEGPWERHVVSGLQPTGALHVGNWLGALRRCVREQEQGHRLTLFVADLHALTSLPEAGALQENTLRVAALALAAGVRPERSALFAQSAVPRHAELCWLLACACSLPRAAALPQFRERASPQLGQLLYPVLQAADVLLHRATHVPVGADQLQHLQLAAHLARAFRRRYGRAFPVPRPLLPAGGNDPLRPASTGSQRPTSEDGSDRIRSLRDPAKKMSKSDPNGRATLFLTDSDNDIRRKIRKAVTDFTPQVTFDPEGRPGVSNLVTLHCLAADKLPEEVVEECDGLTTAQYKEVVAEALCSALGPLRARAAELQRRPRLLRDVLRDGAARARRQADETYDAVARLVGLAPTRAAHTPPTHAVRLPPVADAHVHTDPAVDTHDKQERDAIPPRKAKESSR